MKNNYRDVLLNGLWDRLARHSRSAIAARVFLVDQITHLLSNEDSIN